MFRGDLKGAGTLYPPSTQATFKSPAPLGLIDFYRAIICHDVLNQNLIRLAITLLLANQMSEAEVVKHLEVQNEEANKDYSLDNVDMEQLLKTMAEKFSPSRPSLLI